MNTNMNRAVSARGPRGYARETAWGPSILVLALSWFGIAEAGTLPGGRPALDPDTRPYVAASTPVSGSLSIVGSTTMQPLLVKLVAAFSRFHQDTNIAVEGQGSAEAIREFLVGFTGQRRGEKARDGHDGSAFASILASSRELTSDELNAFRSRYGYEPVAVPIAMDAVTIFVNRENPIGGLTLEQIDAIFGSTRKRGLSDDIRTWGELGLQDGWEHQAIHLHGRDKNSGTRDFLERLVLLDGELKPGVREEPGSASEILAIARDKSAIGYAGVGFQSSYVRAVPVAEKAGMSYVEPTADSVRSRTYPLSRALYLYINHDPKRKLDPLIAEFMRFVNSKDGQETIARAQFYPLTANQIAASLLLLFGSPLAASLPPR